MTGQQQFFPWQESYIKLSDYRQMASQIGGQKYLHTPFDYYSHKWTPKHTSFQKHK